MHKAFVVALLTSALIGCQEGVTVAVVGIPTNTTVSVDSLGQEFARSPAKVYRYKGVGYARVLGVSPAPSYTATARRLDGCVVASGTVENNDEDEVMIGLHPVDGCSVPPPAPSTPPLDMAPSSDLRPSPSSTDLGRDMAAPVDMATPPAPADMIVPTCTPIAALPAPIASNLAPKSCATPVRWATDCQLHCPPEGAGRVYHAFSWALKNDPLGYAMSRTFYATNTDQDVSNLTVGDVLEFTKCGGLFSHTYYNVVKQPLNSSEYGVTVLGGSGSEQPQCPGNLNGRLAPWTSPPVFFYKAS